MANTKATRTAATGPMKDLDGLRRRLQDVQARRDAAQAAFDEAEAQFNADLGASALGELPAMKLARSRAARDGAAQELAGLGAAVGELERRIAAAEAEQTVARKAALLKAIRGRVREARSVVEQALAIEQTMVGLGEEMLGAVNGIHELVSEYRDIDGRTPCTFPALHSEIMGGLHRNSSGLRTGAPEFLAQIWGDRVARGSAEYPVELDVKGRPQQADGGAA
ncbi:MAG: hypothetical protein A2Z66_12875 [Chloroflexi bacterium RBG_13_66_10]|nr:MAG: hypothetical protein A2Z66_12875 [Chloroflexi bacterium RBG_13_66_10]